MSLSKLFHLMHTKNQLNARRRRFNYWANHRDTKRAYLTLRCLHSLPQDPSSHEDTHLHQGDQHLARANNVRILWDNSGWMEYVRIGIQRSTERTSTIET